MKLITDSIYAIEGLQVGRVYLIVGDDGLSLIDSSLPGSEAKIAAEIASIGYSIRDLRRILITHAHFDHIGSLAALQRISQAQVYVHALDAAVTRGEQAQARPDPRSLPLASRLLAAMSSSSAGPAGARVDYELQDHTPLDEVLPGLVALHMPGHSPGHVVYWLPARKLVFCGDVVLNMVGLRLPIRAFTPDMDEERRSLRKMAALAPMILCPGHGQPIIGGAADRLQSFAHKQGR